MSSKVFNKCLRAFFSCQNWFDRIFSVHCVCFQLSRSSSSPSAWKTRATGVNSTVFPKKSRRSFSTGFSRSISALWTPSSGWRWRTKENWWQSCWSIMWATWSSSSEWARRSRTDSCVCEHWWRWSQSGHRELTSKACDEVSNLD